MHVSIRHDTKQKIKGILHTRREVGQHIGIRFFNYVGQHSLHQCILKYLVSSINLYLDATKQELNIHVE